MQACLDLSSMAMQEADEEGDWETKYRAAAIPGRMYLNREEPHLALPLFKSALEIAKDGGLIRWLPCAYLNLAIAHHETGSIFSARRHVETSLDLFRDIASSHPRFAALIANLTWQKYRLHPSVESADTCAVAYRSLAGAINDPDIRVYASARQMRCAADAGLKSLYGRARHELHQALKKTTTMEGVASDLVHAAQGAKVMGEQAVADYLTDLGVRTAEKRGETAVIPLFTAMA